MYVSNQQNTHFRAKSPKKDPIIVQVLYLLTIDTTFIFVVSKLGIVLGPMLSVPWIRQAWSKAEGIQAKQK